VRGSIDKKELLDFVGDVKGKVGIIFDDMLRSGTTMFQAAAAAKRAGAKSVIGLAAHYYGLDSSSQGPFDERLAASELDELIVTNTRPDATDRALRSAALKERITVLDVAPYLARAIRNYETGGTVKDMLASLSDRRELYSVIHAARK
jgi:ribose-phosphate pyrophosphokinase